MPWDPWRLLHGWGFFSSLWGWLLLWTVVQLAVVLIGYQKEILFSYFVHSLYSNYVIEGYNKLLYLPLDFHKKRKIGAVLNSITRTASYLQDIGTRVVSDISGQFVSLIIAVIISLSIDYKFALIMFTGVVCYMTALYFNVGQSVLIQRKVQKGWNRAWGRGWDSVDNVTSVKQLTTEDYESKMNWKNFWQGATKYNLLMSVLNRQIDLYRGLIILLCQLGVLVLSIYLTYKGSLTIGQLVAINGYIGVVFAPFISLGDNWRTIQNGLIYIEETEAIMTAPNENYEPANMVKLLKLNGRIEFKNVSFHYEKKKPVIKNINFLVNPGEVVALVGKSGEGKSTLIDLLSGYHFPTAGQVLIDGVDIRRLSLKFLRSNMAIVPQEVVLFSDTIMTNLRYGNSKKTIVEAKKAAEKAHAVDFIEKFPKKWNQLVGERGVKLSVGQKQRVAIARAILRNPDILILDEPTSALDAESEHFITQSLQELMKGRTTFIIAHRLSTVRRADKIIVLKDGQIAEMGNHDQLMAKENGLYRHLYDLQVNKKEGSSLEDNGGLLENEKESSA